MILRATVEVFDPASTRVCFRTYRVILLNENPVLGVFRQNGSSPLIHDVTNIKIVRVFLKKITLYKLKGTIMLLYGRIFISFVGYLMTLSVARLYSVE
jgi:hypothetical protein